MLDFRREAKRQFELDVANIKRQMTLAADQQRQEAVEAAHEDVCAVHDRSSMTLDSRLLTPVATATHCRHRGGKRRKRKALEIPLRKAGFSVYENFGAGDDH